MGDHQLSADGAFAFISNCGPSPWGHPAPFGLLCSVKMWSWKPGDVSATMRALEIAPNGPTLQKLLVTGQGRCAVGLPVDPDPELALCHGLPCPGRRGGSPPGLKWRDGCWACEQMGSCRFDHAYLMLEGAFAGDRAHTPWLRDDGGRWWQSNGHKPTGPGHLFTPRRRRRSR